MSSYSLACRVFVIPLFLSTLFYVFIAFHVNLNTYPFPIIRVTEREVEGTVSSFDEEGTYTINTYLRDNIEHLAQNKIHNPETILAHPAYPSSLFVFDRLGYIHRIRICNPSPSSSSSTVEVLGFIGGRVLGAMFSNATTIIACDIAKGLIRINLYSSTTTTTRDGTVSSNTTKEEEKKNGTLTTIDEPHLRIDKTIEILTIGTDIPQVTPITFIDDLDITQDGTMVYFSDATDTVPYMKPLSRSLLDTIIANHPAQWTIEEEYAQQLFNNGITYWTTKELSLIDFYRGYGTGKLLRYNTVTKQTEILISNLYFANGVALSKDESFVLVAETFNTRIIRYWLKGPRTGRKEIFAEVPCIPDGISRAYDGGFYVACPSLITPLFAFASRFPTLRWFIGNLPSYLWPPTPKDGIILKLHSNGAPAYALHDQGGKNIHFITAVTEVPDQEFIQQQQQQEQQSVGTRTVTQGWLYFGQLQGSSVPRVRIPQTVKFS